jgi:hydrogenase maturation protease
LAFVPNVAGFVFMSLRKFQPQSWQRQADKTHQRGNGKGCFSAVFSAANRLQFFVRSNFQPPDRRGFLVIGYGNTLRGDDGVGPRVAEAIEKLNLPGVRILVCQQLSPEYADPVSRAHTVVFVDAAVDAPREVQLRKLEPGESSQLMAHAADPRTMLALARDVFGHAPQAWWLTIPAVKLDFSETLTPEAQRGFAEAVEKIQELCR